MTKLFKTGVTASMSTRCSHRRNICIVLLALAVATPSASAGAAESQDLPRCVKDLKIVRSELAPLQTEHPPSGQVELEFTIHALGYVSAPVVVESTAPR